MKRFEYTQTFEQYDDYDSTRESDEVQRVTLVYDSCPYAYLSMKDETERQMTYEEGVDMLQEEVEE